MALVPLSPALGMSKGQQDSAVEKRYRWGSSTGGEAVQGGPGARARACVGLKTSCTSRGTWVLQDSRMLAQTSDGPWVTTMSADGLHGGIRHRRGPGWCDSDVRRQGRCNCMCYRRQAAGNRSRSRMSAPWIKRT
eukprot:144254-Chlamydomonas_euryale.AAC.3